MLSLLVLALFFGGCTVWAYRYVFDHDIIRNYTHRDHVSKGQFNAVAESRFNRPLGWRLFHLDVDDEDETESKRGPDVDNLGRNHNSIHFVIGLCFSVTIAFSIVLVVLLMVQLFGSSTVDLQVFRLVITSLVVMVTMMQPLLVFSLYVNQDLPSAMSLRSFSGLARTAAIWGLWVLWYFLLDEFGSIASFSGADTSPTYIREKTNDVVLAGITITAVLSGVGSISTPMHTFWLDKAQAKRPRSTKSAEARLNELIQSYNSTKMLQNKRQSELNALRATQGGTVYSSQEKGTVRSLKGAGKGLLNRVQSFTSLPGFGASEETELATEIASLSDLKNHIYKDLARELADVLADGSRPKFYSLIRVFNVCFSLYCVYRVGNVLLLRLPYHYFWSSSLHDSSNVIDDPQSSESLNKNTKDALAITVAKIIQGAFGYLPMSETQLINQVSFVLSGSLFVCSFQNVITTFKSLGRFLPTGTTVDSSVKGWLKNLIVSEFLAIYVIATALLIRSNLPVESAEQLSRILSLSSDSAANTLTQMLTEVEFIDTWSDKVFGVTCVVTFFVIASKFLVNSDIDDYDEESLMEDAGFKQS